MKKIATIKDIAKLAGVSTATVSNVLNRKPGVAGAQKVKEIFDIAAELQFQPNFLARNLKRKKTNTIALITEDLTVFNTPEIVDGIDAYCEEQGYEPILANMRLFKRYSNDFADTLMHQELFESIMLNLVAKQVEGVIYVGYHCREIPHSPNSLNIDLPFVYAYCFPKHPNFPTVLFDDEKAAYEAVKLLATYGHRKIGIISGPTESKNSQLRLLGAQMALYECGVLYNTETTIVGDWGKRKGYEATDKLLDMGVTAIFAFNDVMASGVYERCMERSVTIGRDLSLIGYDNIDIDECYSPALTSIEAPLNEMGRSSAELVLKMIRKEAIEKRVVSLPCKMHIRESVGLLNR